MELPAARTLAIELLQEHGLPQQGWRFQFDQAKRRFGICKYQPPIISLSVPLTKRNDAEHVRDTVLHEIAHALAGHAAGHGPEWRRVAESIGARPERCYGNEVNGVEGKFQYRCPGCKRVIHRHKPMTEESACKKCCLTFSGGQFDPQYVFRLAEVDGVPVRKKEAAFVPNKPIVIGLGSGLTGTRPPSRAWSPKQGKKSAPPQPPAPAEEEEWDVPSDLEPSAEEWSGKTSGVPLASPLTDRIVAQLEKELAPKLAADDPLRFFVRAFALVQEESAKANAEIIRTSLTGVIQDTRDAMNAEAHGKLKDLNNEMVKYARAALAAINEGREKANQPLFDVLFEMQNLATESRKNFHLSKWTERIIGALLAGLLVTAGYFLGR